MKLFLSRYSYFVLEGVDDSSGSYDTGSNKNTKKPKKPKGGTKATNVVHVEDIKKSA
ncbi:MAG: hypothetical protein R3A80_05015 [Bdellovibrionota bacterium]